MNKLFFIFICCALWMSCQQKETYREVLATMDAKHQTCLDNGKAMANCSYRYSLQMDSMLNVVYKDLMKVSDEEEKKLLRKEEHIWLEKRDEEMKRIYAAINEAHWTKGISSEDDRMIAYDREAMLVRERVLFLIEMFEKR